MVSEVQRNEFSQLVEQLAISDNIKYIEALACFVEDNDVDPTTVPKLLSKTLREKITLEGVKDNTVLMTTSPAIDKSIFK